jgi:hypothetical protein
MCQTHPRDDLQESERRQLPNRRRNCASQLNAEQVPANPHESVTLENFSNERTTSITLSPTQVNPEPLQLDDELNRGHKVELHPAKNTQQM